MIKIFNKLIIFNNNTGIDFNDGVLISSERIILYLGGKYYE